MKLLLFVFALFSVLQLSHSTPLGRKTGINVGDLKKEEYITCFVNDCYRYYGDPEYKCIPTSSCYGKLYDKDGNFIRDVRVSFSRVLNKPIQIGSLAYLFCHNGSINQSD
ncbi:unnamed protein product [Bursaphelenchus xylophilus]|uniref:(pine wood nematode) hypothetical protein n=1 Tax=Bursaphelenchus xylophilus TaxID=6326 RepID=A0A1I7RUD2_BURXY|nr:unnamed protein product [Bursaphelenchus xylophilus]CAG9114042.1 unnamed protein product [Bursaphelenchus xylophilus]